MDPDDGKWQVVIGECPNRYFPAGLIVGNYKIAAFPGLSLKLLVKLIGCLHKCMNEYVDAKGYMYSQKTKKYTQKMHTTGPMRKLNLNAVKLGM